MKAILLAGGQGTRLRPLTINTPKPIVPIFNRPFLMYQLDLLKKLGGIDEVILSLNYQPKLIEQAMSTCAFDFDIRYIVEPQPLGTAGAIKYAADHLNGSVIVFNGDVLTGIDLAAVVRLHRERNALATIVLTPVENPSIYGLVETDAQQNVRRFIEKPNPDEVTSNTINAGIYVLEPATFDRIPDAVPWSIERKYFPSLVERREPFVAYIHDGYWLDIGTPEKYLQAHCDVMDGRLLAAPFHQTVRAALVSRAAVIEEGVQIDAPCFIDDGVVIRKDSHVGAYSVIGRDCAIEEGVNIRQSILWPETSVGRESTIDGAVLGRQCIVGRATLIRPGAVLGDGSHLTDYSQA